MIDCVVEIEILFKYLFLNNDFILSKPKSIFYKNTVNFKQEKIIRGKCLNACWRILYWAFFFCFVSKLSQLSQILHSNMIGLLYLTSC